MSQKLFNLNADLRRLREEGYFVQIRGGLLVMREVPYVDSQKRVRMGTLVTSLDLAGDTTRKPESHVAHWDGEFPCRADGTPLQEIAHQSQVIDLGHGVTARYSFSSKPGPEGYPNYFEKMSTYATILAGPAAVLQPGISPRVFRAPDDTEADSVFNYIDTASDRVGIGGLSAKFEDEIISVIGTGGTGGYILDLVAKTPVREIRLFDADEFLQHNAFRAPGAPSLEELREAPKKVDYLKSIYSRMHRGIVVHSVKLEQANVELLNGTTFAFISMDAGEDKRAVVEKLEALGVPFVDVGMGLELVDGSLGGILRVTASTPQKREHVHAGRISLAGGGERDVYASNIQVADLNALNAALAVIKWKKLRGFYRDLDREHHSTYTTDGNLLLNSDQE
ncbi:ThiF family adenylyltransferase [Burkholderia glumae]|uniref:ThiF family adenylyltransferase n=1 Tax=Burkholderia glumae TaxID=337 RepID=UPI00148EAD1D|nr:ThiF family adenylyltransferase [Burkholderia glumae]MCM2549248.1 ThiF family adenylyltransferase [Burkholderia glumae]MCQ0033099.1 ThiF family adenylyltransferase [Burkholderia glumae]MCQ0036066.1 ThiF family adenylyltransferase [Burkholderia glumae]QJW79107.1 ThiF family adenylyltransferase [Burkholderia glumae]UVS85903.1 ThiF family adenylyltransferase [Burkholderia glumae]